MAKAPRITGRKRTSSSGASGMAKKVKMAPPSNSVNTAAATKSMSMKSKSSRRGRLGGSVKKRLSRLESDLLLSVDRKHKLQTDVTNASAASGAPQKLLLNGLTKGSDQSQRVGNFINLGKGHCSMKIRWKNTSSTFVDINRTLRLIVVLRKCTGATAFVFTDLFRSLTPSTQEFFDFSQKPVFQNHRILFDKVYEAKQPVAAGDGTTFSNGDTETHIQFGWDCRNYRAKYIGTGNAGTIGDIDDGAVHLLMITTETVVTALNLQFDIVQYFTEKKAY